MGWRARTAAASIKDGVYFCCSSSHSGGTFSSRNGRGRISSLAGPVEGRWPLKMRHYPYPSRHCKQHELIPISPGLHIIDSVHCRLGCGLLALDRTCDGSIVVISPMLSHSMYT